jgi:uroporphyrinogen decarboxylase
VDSRSRVLAALKGEPVDHVPISFWGHQYIAENSAEGLAQETLRQARLFDWDYLKPQSRAQSFAEMWGLTYAPSQQPTQKYTVTHVPVADAADLGKVSPKDPTGGALGEQLEALRQIRAAVGPDVPIIWTVFSPLMVSRYLVVGDAGQLLEIGRTQPAQLEAALEAITETLVLYVSECIANGADGIFYATNMATQGQLTTDECGRWQRAYDLRVLEAVQSAPFNVMHVCGQRSLFDAFADYPVTAYSWAAGPENGNPSLHEGHQRTGKASMGGIPNKLSGIQRDEIARRVRSAVSEMDGRWLLLAPDCSVEITGHDDLLLAARDAAR